MKPTRGEAEAAVRTLLEYVGEDLSREGLLDTPSRVVRAWEEWFQGYAQDPVGLLSTTFQEVAGYREAVVLSGIRVASHCEHHLTPILGEAAVAYLPRDRVVGISKLARVVRAYSRRAVVQEALTAQIADAIQEALDPRGVAVLVRAQHLCMATRGVNDPGVSMTTTALRGLYQEDHLERSHVLGLLGVR